MLPASQAPTPLTSRSRLDRVLSLFTEVRPGEGPIGTIVSLALFLPGLSVSVRRLHDIDRTGWWVLLSFTIIGIILLIVWDCMRGTPGPNRFGPDPLGGM